MIGTNTAIAFPLFGMPLTAQRSGPTMLNGYAGIVDTLEGVVRQKPGALIYMGQWDMPEFEGHLFDAAKRLSGARFFQLLSKGMRWNAPDVAPHLSLYTVFGGPGSRGCKNFLHLHLDDYPKIFDSEKWRPDVAIVAISRENGHGRVTLGPDAGLSMRAVTNARMRIGIQNMEAPMFAEKRFWHEGEMIHSGCSFDIRDFDYVVRVWSKYADYDMLPALEQAEERMAKAIASLVPNGAVLQAGIGNPDMMLRPDLYAGHEGLRVFAELVGPNAWELAKQQSDTAPVWAGFVAGPRRFLADLDRDRNGKRLVILPVEQMVNTTFIKRMCGGKLISLAGALEVDARAAVSSSAIGTMMFSGPGGAYRYADAAVQTGGMSIVVMPSTYLHKDGKPRSRVVSTFAPGTPITLSVRTASRICTDQGISDELHEMTDTEHLTQMVGLCHPDFRDEMVANIKRDYGRSIDPKMATELVAFERLGV